jgi:small RNA 2'-O-methyltransferase
MAIVTIASTNPDLSWVLEKMPAAVSGSKKPYTKKLRDGVVYGWFLGAQSTLFRLWFRDSETSSSYADEAYKSFEYLDTTRYGSPYLPISIITNCLMTALKKPNEKDAATGFTTTVRMTIKVPNLRFFKLLQKAYLEKKGVYIDAHGITKGTHIDEAPDPTEFYEVEVGASTVYQALNIACVVCIMQAVSDDQTDVTLNKEAIEKYVNCLNAADAPYFVRYLFSMRAINTRSVFDRLQSKISTLGMSLAYGNTRQQRYDAIEKHLKGGDTFVDIGCGEGFYSLKRFIKYGVTFAIDKDQETSEILAGKVKRRQLDDKIEPMHADVTPEWVSENQDVFDGADVLLTEVVEHMPLEEASALVKAILRTKFRKLIITTPNRDFNVNYGMTTTEMRHDDHKWEFSHEEFVAWINGMVAEVHSQWGFSRYWMPIGDKVGAHHVSTGVVIKPQTEADVVEYQRRAEMALQVEHISTVIEIVDPIGDELPVTRPPVNDDTAPSETSPV